MSADAVELLIFDCDGVLTDSERIAVKVDVQLLAELGWPLSEAEVIERFMGRSDRETRMAIETHLGRSLPDDWQQLVEGRYRTAFSAELRPVPGIVDALDQLVLRNCVASSGTHDHLRFTLGLTGLYDRFRGRIFSAEDVAAGKPAPDVFVYAAEQMRVEPACCLVVEDSLNGVRAARAAGMRVLAYGGGLTPPELLAGPDTLVFEDMRDLPKLISPNTAAGPTTIGRAS
jgi:HAD superfamily hydrolase (TIGR01509 family)